MIMVDELRCWLDSPKKWCHLTTDGELEDLHAFACKLGLKREWFQPKSSPHYDLTPAMRTKALRAGAVYVGAVPQARERIRKRRESSG
jgi:hypothetical protein